MNSKLSPMEQLIGFVEYEKQANPGRKHIAEWALDEINRLHDAALSAQEVPPQTQALWDACKKAAEAERHACSIVVWMTAMEAEEPDSDDLGVSGWLHEAERRVKNRTGQSPKADDSELRDMLVKCAGKARDALVSGDFNAARPAIAALASFADGAAYFDAVPLTAAPAAPKQAEACKWTRDKNPDYDIWNSACGEAWSFMDGGPAENSVRFCQGCGKPVKLAPAAPQD